MNCLCTAELFKSPSHKCPALQRQACVGSHVGRLKTRQATKCSPQRLIFLSLFRYVEKKRKFSFWYRAKAKLASDRGVGTGTKWGLHRPQPLSATLNSKMADEGAIPLVDFSVMGLNCANPPSQDDESVKLLAEKIHTAFSTIGFVYLSNHGISDEEASLL